MPQHVVDYLIAVGKLDSDGMTRKARVTSCRKCGSVIIAGLDHDHHAAPVRVDPSPLSPAGEVEALLSGRHTFDVSRLVGTYRIDPRETTHIVRRPAGSRRGTDTVAEHRCGSPALSGIESRLAIRSPSSIGDRCPF